MLGSSPLQGEVRRGGFSLRSDCLKNIKPKISYMTKVFNKSSEREKRRYLRNNMPKAELLLWSELKGRKLRGYKFRRQYGVNGFVLDFYCPELKLALEVDGDSHFQEGMEVNDLERQLIIESYGITFLRFTNNDVYENMTAVLERILEFMEEVKE